MRRSAAGVLDEIANDEDLGSCVELDHTLDGQKAREGALPERLEPRVLRGLAARGISSLYEHQRSAIASLAEGHDVVLATPTASGKSLCYQLPILDAAARGPEARALLLFPTKALGQDQVNALLSAAEACEIELKVHTFDGDTPSSVRQAVRREAQVVVTNPDMLHQGILPHHPSWMSFFRNLEIVVVDELHTYRGVFGSHVGNVLRRLERICSFYGSRPRFVFGSATIGNPAELAQALSGRDPVLIERSGAPRGPRRLVVARPPIVNRPLGIRQSYILFARKLVRHFLKAKVPTIVFALSRLNVEVLLKYARDDLKQMRQNPELAQGYRGGYLPGTRRAIERGLRDGSVRFVVSTNALELGIDIGSLEACLVVGWPGSVASFWQQAGRAGRRERPAAVVYVPRSNPLDQFVATEPAYLLQSRPENARVDPDNLVILAEHLKCAAFELPFEQGQRFGGLDKEDTTEVLDELAGHRMLHSHRGRYHWTDRTYPANHVSLRSVPGDNFVVIDLGRDRLIAETDFKSAHTTLYEGAIYNLHGVQHEVLKLDYDGHKAYVRRVKPDYFTEALTYVRVKPLEVELGLDRGRLRIEHGDVKVTSKVIGFKKIRFETNENVGYGEVDLPELRLHTRGAWLVMPGAALYEAALQASKAAAQANRPVGLEDLALDALLGLSHALHHLAVLRMMCDVHDLGRCVGDRSEDGFTAVAHPRPSPSPNRGRRGPNINPLAFDPTLFLYDTCPGGIGLCERLAPELPELLGEAGELVARCACPAGCPSCLGAFASPRPELKMAAVLLVQAVLEEGSRRGAEAQRRSLPEGSRRGAEAQRKGLSELPHSVAAGT